MKAIGTSLLVVAFSAAAEPTPAKVPVSAKEVIDYEAELNDRLSKGIKPVTNANVLIVKALGPKPEGGDGHPAEYYKQLGIDPLPEKGDYFVGLTAFPRDQLKLTPEELKTFWDQQGRASKAPWTARDYPQIAAWLETNEKPLALVIEGTKRPQYYDPVIVRRTEKGPGMLMGALIPNVQKSRELAAALTARAMLRTAEAKYDEAWQDLLACHRLGRHVGRATLIHSLVGIAVDAVAARAGLAFLANAKLTVQQIEGCRKDLHKLPPMPPISGVLDVGERIVYLDSLQHIRLGTDATPEERRNLAKLDWQPALTNGMKFYDRMVAASRLPTRTARERAFDGIEEDLDAMVKETKKEQNPLQMLFGNPGKTAGKQIGAVFTSLLAPALRKVQSAHDRATQIESNLHLAFALAAHRADTGRYPAKLDDLAPKYLDKVPDDLFSAKPLIYRPTEKGYLLYSIGVDGKDSGGRPHEEDLSSDDIVVQMPLPPLKGKE